MHGYGTCATGLFSYSYAMNFFVLDSIKEKQNLAAKQACAYTF